MQAGVKGKQGGKEEMRGEMRKKKQMKAEQSEDAASCSCKDGRCCTQCYRQKQAQAVNGTGGAEEVVGPLWEHSHLLTLQNQEILISLGCIWNALSVLCIRVGCCAKVMLKHFLQRLCCKQLSSERGGNGEGAGQGSLLMERDCSLTDLRDGSCFFLQARP